MQCNGKVLNKEQVDKLQFMINNYSNKGMDICTCDVERVLNKQYMKLTKLEKAIALSIVFNAIDTKELDGHVSKEKLSDVLKIIEALKEEIDADKELEEEKEAHLNIINKLIDSLLAEKNQEQKEPSPPFKNKAKPLRGTERGASRNTQVIAIGGVVMGGVKFYER
ncbi:hypothetical protein DF16_orf04912 [Bacillus thuringiensis serovar kurstaki str. YBT-1520]|uniref:hypothetical protein n=2 Tax=Bacillus thuringiensis TaxID=1428 RepID=UPI0004F62189|nr:hypothetical protein [Bacillus thuringiensis]AIM33327.1 hypothetical protein DF16_orf04912 [Bacillus thuringiensis serovar kurstaki str. YBT-1520]